jgi:hypothetical protein
MLVYELYALQATKTASSTHLSALASSKSLGSMGTGSPGLRSPASSSALGAPLLEESTLEQENSNVESHSELESEHDILHVATDELLNGDMSELQLQQELATEGPERVRTESEDVRSIIQAATTLFVDEWHLANENHIDHHDEHDLDNDSDSYTGSYNDSSFVDSFSDEEDEREGKNMEESSTGSNVKDKDA